MRELDRGRSKETLRSLAYELFNNREELRLNSLNRLKAKEKSTISHYWPWLKMILLSLACKRIWNHM